MRSNQSDAEPFHLLQPRLTAELSFAEQMAVAGRAISSVNIDCHMSACTCFSCKRLLMTSQPRLDVGRKLRPSCVNTSLPVGPLRCAKSASARTT